MILFITRKYPPAVGGMENLSYHLTQEISAREPSYIISWGRSQRWLPLFVIMALVRAAWVLMHESISIVHIGDPVLLPVGILLGRIWHVPIVVTAHGLDVTFPNPIYQSIVSFCLCKSDRVICISEYARAECMKRGAQAERCHVIPPGIVIPSDVIAGDRECIPQEDRDAFLSRVCGRDVRAKKSLITVGRLVCRKGVAPFIARGLPLLREYRDDWVYLVVGRGPELESIRQAIQDAQMDDYVYLLGTLSDSDLHTLYMISDVFVMPNIPVPNDCEGFGIVSLEARVTGTPVVAADLEGIRDSMQLEIDGFLVAPHDYDGYIQAIEALLAQQRSVDVAHARQKSIIDRYGWPVIAFHYLEVFDQVRDRVKQEHGGPR
jgi:phosphatidylinositol alpha-1,6-mannosyltransferase